MPDMDFLQLKGNMLNSSTTEKHKNGQKQASNTNQNRSCSQTARTRKPDASAALGLMILDNFHIWDAREGLPHDLTCYFFTWRFIMTKKHRRRSC